jgi:hypothetical protein
VFRKALARGPAYAPRRCCKTLLYHKRHAEKAHAADSAASDTFPLPVTDRHSNINGPYPSFYCNSRERRVFYTQIASMQTNTHEHMWKTVNCEKEACDSRLADTPMQPPAQPQRQYPPSFPRDATIRSASLKLSWLPSCLALLRLAKPRSISALFITHILSLYSKSAQTRARFLSPNRPNRDESKGPVSGKLDIRVQRDRTELPSPLV